MGEARLSALALLTLACSSPPESVVSSSEQPVVYGADDRLELYAAGAPLQRFGERSSVALVDEATLSGTAQGDPRNVFAATTWAERSGVCPSVRFAEQPAAASCSGVLAGRDLVLTAGHCARDLDCSALHFVFGYHYLDGHRIPRLDDDDVYRCAERLAFEVPTNSDGVDYGWFRLDRAVAAERRPASIARVASAIDPAARLQLLAHGGGLPLKAQSDVFARDSRADALDYFVTALDAFEAASGGAVIDDTGRVVGVLARGSKDYVSTDAGCLDVSVLPESAAAERATYAFQALAGLCRDAPEASELCHDAAHRVGCSFTPISRRGAITRSLFAALVVCIVRRRRRGARI